MKRLREVWPDVKITIRADGGFCRWRLMRWCDRHGVDYILGLAGNSRLLEAFQSLTAQSVEAFHQTREKQRLFGGLSYAAKTWDRERRVIAKAEHTDKGSNPRFVVTSLEVDPQPHYDDLHCARGEMENRIKEQQVGLFADRTSCCDFIANQFRAGKPRSRVIKVLGEQDPLVEYFMPVNKSAWMSDEEWKRLPDSITVREIRRTIVSGTLTIQRNGFRPITVTIMTTLLDAEQYPADDLIELRLTRWLIETNFRHLKITLWMDVLNCKTLDGVRKERLIFILVYNLIRCVTLHAARRESVHGNRLSFADALAWLHYARNQRDASPTLIVNPLRPGRLEPRKLNGQNEEFPA